jgi:hypothetical protein
MAVLLVYCAAGARVNAGSDKPHAAEAVDLFVYRWNLSDN